MKIRQRRHRNSPLTLRHGRECVIRIVLGETNAAVKSGIGLFGGALEIENLPTANEMNSVGTFGIVNAGIKADGGKLAQFVIEFFAKSHELAEIEGAKVEKEIPIYKFVVNTKEMDLFLFTVFLTARKAS